MGSDTACVSKMFAWNVFSGDTPQELFIRFLKDTNIQFISSIWPKQPTH